MMRYYTSDWHLGENRIGLNGKPNLFFRPFDSIELQNYTIYTEFLKFFRDGDTLYHLGDVLYNTDEESQRYLKRIREDFPHSKFHLIIGNYDEAPDKFEILSKYFDVMHSETTVVIKDREYYLNHYPNNCVDKEFAITGHIHGLWKVQKNMVNVGVDAWHFRPVSEDQIDFCRTACEKYYDTNVFPKITR